MTSTKLDTGTVKASAASLGRIMDDTAAFSSLRTDVAKLGNFDLAAQLDAIVEDRRRGVLDGADQLKVTLEDMEKALTKIADQIRSIDDGTAEKIRAVIADLRTRVGDDVAYEQV